MWPNFSYRGVRSVQLLLLLLLLMVFSSENFGFSPPYAGIAGIGPACPLFSLSSSLSPSTRTLPSEGAWTTQRLLSTCHCASEVDLEKQHLNIVLNIQYQDERRYYRYTDVHKGRPNASNASDTWQRYITPHNTFHVSQYRCSKLQLCTACIICVLLEPCLETDKISKTPLRCK